MCELLVVRNVFSDAAADFEWFSGLDGAREAEVRIGDVGVLFASPPRGKPISARDGAALFRMGFPVFGTVAV